MEEEKKSVDNESINQSINPSIKPSFGHPLLSHPLPPNQLINQSINQSIQPLSPEIQSPLSSNGSDSDDDSDSDAETKLRRSAALYQQPMIYYKRVSSLAQNAKIDLHSVPSQIMMPDGSQMIGLPYSQSATDSETERNFMIFSLPTDEMRARRRIMELLLYGLLPIDIALCAVIYANADWLKSASFSDGEFSIESFITVILMCFLCGMGVRLRGTRLLTLASCLFVIDACINFLRCFNVVQIAHFVLELTIAAITMHFKQCCQPTWFTPRL